jgi:hypothetical protein
MPGQANKRELLEHAGFVYNFDREVYFNRTARKIFSVEAIEDHDPTWLRSCIEEDNGSTEWRFYFNSPPSDIVRQELVGELR